MKKLAIYLIFMFDAFMMLSQQVEVNADKQINLSFVHVVLSQYIKSEKPEKNLIILIDCIFTDTISVFTVLESENQFELFYRKPQCYFIDSDRIIYIHTNNIQTTCVDTVYLDNLFYNTLKILYYSNENVNDDFFKELKRENVLTHDSYQVSWRNDSIVSMKGVLTWVKHMSFDPVPFQYIVKDGKVINKKIVKRVLLPDIGSPKGTANHYFRTEPYWKKNN
jgi:hypothetical protein